MIFIDAPLLSIILDFSWFNRTIFATELWQFESDLRSSRNKSLISPPPCPQKGRPEARSFGFRSCMQRPARPEYLEYVTNATLELNEIVNLIFGLMKLPWKRWV